MTYHARVIDTALSEVLGYSGAVLLEGVRACGKTETGRRHSASEVALDSGLPAVNAALSLDPRLLLDGDTPRLIDEWQLAPELWNIVRRTVDDRRSPGQFIMTGSAVPAEDAQRHSGAHRISRIRMRPMTLFEQGRGTGAVSLGALFEGGHGETSLNNSITVPDALDALIHGGWPSDLELTTKHSSRHLRDYLDDVITTDIGRLDGEPRRDPDRLRVFLQSVARNLATEAKYATIARDMSGTAAVKPETVSAYVGALERLFILEIQPAWAPHVRSKAALRVTPKLHFVDPALAAALLGATTDRVMHDLNTAGLWFESQVVQHVRVFAESIQGRVYHYRDSSGREVDIIVQLDDGRWGAIEVKLGQRQLPTAQKSLSTFAETIDTSRSGSPSFLAVVTADGPVMTLPDGVLTFPLHALRP